MVRIGEAPRLAFEESFLLFVIPPAVTGDRDRLDTVALEHPLRGGFDLGALERAQRRPLELDEVIRLVVAVDVLIPFERSRVPHMDHPEPRFEISRIGVAHRRFPPLRASRKTLVISKSRPISTETVSFGP